MKKVYQFDLIVGKKEDWVSTQNEKGEETKVKKQVDDIRTYVFKHPSYAEQQEARLERDAYFSYCSRKKGLMTKAELAKRFADNQGVLTDEDSKKLVDCTSEMSKLQIQRAEKQSEKSEEDNPELLEKLEKELFSINHRINLMYREISMIESAYQDLFNCTADTWADSRYLTWHVIMLSFYIGEGDEYIPVFKGKNFEEKYKDFEKKQDELAEDENFQKFIKVAQRVLTYFVLGIASNQKEVEEIRQKLNDKF